jgi:hypothetical protein
MIFRSHTNCALNIPASISIYARYLTDLQAVTSIEDQIRVCRERIEHEGWIYVHAYHDRAMIGSSHLRPG